MDATPQTRLHDTDHGTPYTPDVAARAGRPDDGGRPARIAVLAVHGVGDQVPFESARSIAKLLVGRGSGATYESVHEQTLHVPVRPMWDRTSAPRADSATDGEGREGRLGRLVGWITAAMWALLAGLASPFRAIGGVRRRAGYTKQAAAGNRALHDDDLSLLLMDEQLRGYRGGEPSGTLTTVRLETRRRADAAAPHDAEVHVHELFWADLSRPGNTFVRIAAELYQVFLHLANLGALLLDNQAARCGGAWRRFAEQHGFAVGLITTVIPVWNLVMAGTLLALPLMSIPDGKLRWGVTVIVAILAAWAGERSLGRRRPGSTMRHLLGQLGVGTVVGVVTGIGMFYLTARVVGAQHYVAAALWVAVAWLLGRSLTRKWDRHQPGVVEVGRAVGALWLLTIIAALVWANGRYIEPRAVTVIAALRASEVLLVGLGFWWVVLLALSAALWGRGAYLGRRDALHPELRDEVRRTTVTARATLALTTVGVLIVTLLGWAGLFAAFGRFVPEDIGYWPLAGGISAPANEAVQTLLVSGVSSGIIPLLVFVLVAILVILWTFLPVVWGEVRPPRPTAAEADEVAADLTGKRLTLAYRSARIGGMLLSASLVLFLFGIVNDVVLHAVPSLENTAVFRAIDVWPKLEKVEELTLWVAGALGLSTIGLFLLRGRLDALVLGLRPVLDVALDVDNYLRIHPGEDTPRARMVERYTSVLASLLAQAPATGQRPYDALVIVAHSQGTVISTDLLRYIRSNRAGLARSLGFVDRNGDWAPPMPVYLFTMGCPLRQLYQLRFPALYGWLGTASVADRRVVAPGAEPRREAVGVDAWYNVYRSGDYVGRQLWFDEASCPDIFRRVKGRASRPDELHFASDPDATRYEACLGAGAHTHYWDDTAPEVARTLDELIVRAATVKQAMAGGT